MKTCKNQLTKLLCLALLVFSAVYISLSAVYNLVLSNIVYSKTLLPTVMEFALSLCDLCAYAVCFAIIIYSIYLFGVKPSMPKVLIYGGALLAKMLIDTTVALLMFGGGWRLEELLYILLMWLFELGLAFVVVLISHLFFKNKENSTFEFTKLYSRENDLQSSALTVAAVIAGIKFLSRLIYDIGYGLPSGLSDLLWMLAGYASDILSGIIVYLVAIILMKKLKKLFESET